MRAKYSYRKRNGEKAVHCSECFYGGNAHLITKFSQEEIEEMGPENCFGSEIKDFKGNESCFCGKGQLLNIYDCFANEG